MRLKNWFAVIFSLLFLVSFSSTPVFANPVAVVAGGIVAIGWFWFITLLVVIMVFADVLAQKDNLWGSLFVFVVGVAFLVYLNTGLIPWFRSLTWGQIIGWPVFYVLILGVCWSIARFALFQRRGTKEYKESMSLSRKNYIRDKYRLSNNKTKFYGWILFWPVDMGVYLVSEFAQDVIDWLRDLIRPVLEKIESWFWSGIDTELAAENAQAKAEEDERRRKQQEEWDTTRQALEDMRSALEREHEEELLHSLEEMEAMRSMRSLEESSPAPGMSRPVISLVDESTVRPDGYPPHTILSPVVEDATEEEEEYEIPGIGSGELVSERVSVSSVETEDEPEAQEAKETESDSVEEESKDSES